MFKLLSLSFLLILSIPSYASSERESLASDIKKMVADLSCDDSVQCKSIGFGSRVCGGYYSYIIYSTKNVYEVKLDQLAAKYYQLDKKHNESSNMGSICIVAYPRVAKCIEGNCVDMGDELNYKLH